MTEPATDRFGPLLRRLRLVAALSQEELAERAGLSARGISALETGYRATPRPETVRLLADALGLDAAARAELVAAARPELTAPAGARPRAAPVVAARRWRRRCRSRRRAWSAASGRWPRSAPSCAGRRSGC